MLAVRPDCWHVRLSCALFQYDGTGNAVGGTWRFLPFLGQASPCAILAIRNSPLYISINMKRLLNNVVRWTIIAALVVICALLYISPRKPAGEEKWPSFVDSATLLQFRNHPDNMIIPPADIALATEILDQSEALWAELQEFKDDADLRQIRFAEDTRYGDWMQKLRLLIESRPPKEVIGSDLYQLPVQLQIVAQDCAGRKIGCYEQTIEEEKFRNYYLPVARQSVNESEETH